MRDFYWGTAVHKAGHAVAHYLLDLAVPEVSIVPDEESDGCCFGFSASNWISQTVETTAHQPANGQLTNDRLRCAVEDHVVALIAGGLTEMQFLGQSGHDAGPGDNEVSPDGIIRKVGECGSGWDKLITDDDLTQAFFLLEQISSGKDAARAYLNRLHRRTLNLIRWPAYTAAIEALAGQLLREGSMAGKQANETIRSAVRAFQDEEDVDLRSSVPAASDSYHLSAS